MRKIGAHVSAAGGPHNAIINAHDIGCNCVQIFAGSPRSWARSLYKEDQIKKFKEVSTQYSITPLYIHSLYLINLASENKENLKKSIDSLIMDLKNGDLLDSAGVVVHTGSHLGMGFDTIKEELVKTIKHILSETKNTPLLLENTSGQKGKIGTLEELEYLLKHIDSDRLGVCLDTAHLFEAGVDIRDNAHLENYVKELKDRNILSKVKLIHLNDSRTKLGSTKDEHENIGDGEIGKDGLKKFITHKELSHLPLILEVPGEKGMPDRDNIDRVRSII